MKLWSTSSRRCPPVDILEVAKALRRAYADLVVELEQTNDTPEGLKLYEAALWQRTMAGCDVFAVENLAAELRRT